MLRMYACAVVSAEIWHGVKWLAGEKNKLKIRLSLGVLSGPAGCILSLGSQLSREDRNRKRRRGKTG